MPTAQTSFGPLPHNPQMSRFGSSFTSKVAPSKWLGAASRKPNQRSCAPAPQMAVPIWGRPAAATADQVCPFQW